jgi:hypothetical protein
VLVAVGLVLPQWGWWRISPEDVALPMHAPMALSMRAALTCRSSLGTPAP